MGGRGTHHPGDTHSPEGTPRTLRGHSQPWGAPRTRGGTWPALLAGDRGGRWQSLRVRELGWDPGPGWETMGWPHPALPVHTAHTCTCTHVCTRMGEHMHPAHRDPCTHVHTHTCMTVHSPEETCTHTHRPARTHRSPQTHTQTCTDTHRPAHTQESTDTYTYRCALTHTHTHTDVYSHTLSHTDVHTPLSSPTPPLAPLLTLRFHRPRWHLTLATSQTSPRGCSMARAVACTRDTHGLVFSSWRCGAG